jgi:poly(3-hydroxybutyrate) depolymerase
LDPPAEQALTVPGTRTGYSEFFVNQTGANLTSTDEPSKTGPRQFFVRVPADYDKTRPYRVVYLLQGCGALRAANVATYPLFDEQQGGSEQVVYVAVSIPDQNVNNQCYDNNAGPNSLEWEAFDLIHTFVEGHYCVDNDRVFVAGYSTGGWVSNMYGCYFAGTPSPPLDAPDLAAGRTVRKFSPRWAVRGHAAVTGSMPPNEPLPCNGPAAGLWFHDSLDKSSLIQTNISALELALKTNGCVGNYADGPKEPWAPGENIPDLQGGVCQRYTGCPADVLERYPLVFCTTQGFGHQDQAARFIPAFTAFAKGLDPKP